MKKWLKTGALILVGFITGMMTCIHLYNLVEDEMNTDEYEENEFENMDI